MSKSSVLIVEDEQIVSMDIKNNLEHLGYIIAGQADRGEDAVKKAGELRPDLILMDISLKGEMDGIEAASQIRTQFDLPIIFLTAFANQSTLERARQAEPYGYILKPFETHELVIAIEMAVYKHSMERKLRESEERYELAARGANDGLWDWNLKKNEIHYSLRWKAMLGFKEEEIGNNPDEWLKRIHREDRKRVQENIISHINGNTPHFENEYRIKHANGSDVWVLCRGLAVRDAGGNAYRMAGSQTDITTRKMAEDRLAYDSLHDVLTKLPNRALFMDRLEHRLENAKRHPKQLFAILFVDLDRFKVVNDSLGHAVGDQLIVATSQRLQQCVRPGDTVSRLGGDEFAILLNEVSDTADATRVADRILARLVSTSMLDSVKRSTTASIGIALFDVNSTKPDDYLRNADTAMYRAKALGGNRHQIFDSTMHANAVALLEMEGELRHAVEHQEWLVEYQPIVSLADNKILGVEALIRWMHPKRGLIPPLKFINVAEESGLIHPIGEYVLRAACTQAVKWRKTGYPDLWVSVNISGRQFQDQKLVKTIKQILAETGLAPDGLLLEITESVAMKDFNYSVKILKELNALGIHVALDDFGNGYSSLGYLKSFPLKVLKIDKSFIQDIAVNKNSDAITTAIIAIGRTLNLEVVAEGVETINQLEFLKARNCDRIQGFLHSHPMNGNDVFKSVKEM
ncbi:MAG: EAL domain-containing protein [Chloroflexi bacterium]|nr:EAL domain-containing protein [Chloroflexota bacterium]